MLSCDFGGVHVSLLSLLNYAGICFVPSVQLELDKIFVKIIHLRLSPFSPTLIDMNNLVVRNTKECVLRICRNF